MLYVVLDGCLCENWYSDVWELSKQCVILVVTCDCEIEMRNRCSGYPKWNSLVGPHQQVVCS